MTRPPCARPWRRFPPPKTLAAGRGSFTASCCPFAEHDADALSRVLAVSDQAQILVYSIPIPKAWYEALAARGRSGCPRGLHRRTPGGGETGAGQPEQFAAAKFAGDDRRGSRPHGRHRRGPTCLCVGHVFRSKPVIGCNLAVVYAWLGQPDQAFVELREMDGRAGRKQHAFIAHLRRFPAQPGLGPVAGRPALRAAHPAPCPQGSARRCRAPLDG